MTYVTNTERIGIKKGIKKGIEQGIEQGIERTTRELALKMLRRGMERGEVSEITGLSMEQLQTIQRENP
jgi:predicted transposase/invertase (TIGR01784 family)